MSKKIIFLLLICGICSSKVNAQQKVDTLNPGAILPFKFVDIAGPRPTISYKINGKDATSMIHSNAGQYLQLSPDNAKYFGITDWQDDGVFGISEPGKVNKRYKAFVNELAFGGIILNHKNVAIFNKYPADKQGFGMLGRAWIRENRIILNYKNNTVAIRPDKSQLDSIQSKISAEGYISIPMQMDSVKKQYFAAVTINGVTTKFTVSTVAELEIDSVLAKRAGIEIGKIAGDYAGPTGQLGHTYKSKNEFQIFVGQFSKTIKARILDLYNYSEIKRPVNDSEYVGGTLGANFMIANKAVIDFGNLKLYLKKTRND